MLAGQEDWMLPSGKEAKRLEKLLPRCSSVIFEGRSHALLQEAGIDLPQIMKVSGIFLLCSCVMMSYQESQQKSMCTSGDWVR